MAQMHQATLPHWRMPCARDLIRRFLTPPSSLREGETPGQPLPSLGIEDAKVSGYRSGVSPALCSLPPLGCPCPGTRVLRQSRQHWDQTAICVDHLPRLLVAWSSTAKAHSPAVPGARGDSEGRQDKGEGKRGAPRSHLHSAGQAPPSLPRF